PISSVTRDRCRTGTLGRGTRTLSEAGNRCTRRAASRGLAVPAAAACEPAWCEPAWCEPAWCEPAWCEPAPCGPRRFSEWTGGWLIVLVIDPRGGGSPTLDRPASPPSRRTNVQLQPATTVPASCGYQPRITPGSAASAHSSLVVFAERLAQLGFLLGAEVGADQFGLRVLEAVLDAVHHGVRAEQEERGGPRRDLLPDVADERVADADVGHRPDQGSGRCSDRQAENRDEEDEAEEQTPEAAAERARPFGAAQLARLRLILPNLPADDSRIQYLDELL